MQTNWSSALRRRLNRTSVPAPHEPPVVPTIVLPEMRPNIIVTLPKERRPWWQLVLIFVSAAIPITISAAALRYAVLTYNDQHNDSVSAAQATARAEAGLVSFRLTPNQKNVIIQNLAHIPIRDMVMTMETTIGRGTKPVLISVPLGLLPSCNGAEWPFRSFFYEASAHGLSEDLDYVSSYSSSTPTALAGHCTTMERCNSQAFHATSMELRLIFLSLSI